LGEREHRAVDYIPVDSPELLDIDVLFPPCILKYERAPGVGRGSSSRCSCLFYQPNFLLQNRPPPDIIYWNPPLPKGPNERPNEAGSGSFKSGTFRPFPLCIPCLPLPHSLPLSLLPPSPGGQNREKTWNEQLEDEGALSLRRTPPAHSSPIHYPHLC
jgi:hypothetical protein